MKFMQKTITKFAIVMTVVIGFFCGIFLLPTFESNLTASAYTQSIRTANVYLGSLANSSYVNSFTTISPGSVKCIKFIKDTKIPLSGSTAILGEKGETDDEGKIVSKTYSYVINWVSSTGTLSYITGGTFIAPKSCSEWFYYFENLEEVHFDNLDTSGTTSMSGMFFELEKLTNVINFDKLNTASVTDMSEMFYSCERLTNIKFPSNFITSNVENVSYMFYNCSSLVSFDFTYWVFDGCTASGSMDRFIAGCSGVTSITSIKNLYDHANNKLKEMNYWFENWQQLKSGLTLGETSNTICASDMVTSNVTSMQGLFKGCSSVNSLTTINNYFKRPAVRNYSYFISGIGAEKIDLRNDVLPDVAEQIEAGTPSINAFNFSHVVASCRYLKTLSNLEWFSKSGKTGNSYDGVITSAAGLFHGLSIYETDSDGDGINDALRLKGTGTDISVFDSSAVTDATYMFADCDSITDLGLISENFDIASVQNMSYMFYTCDGLIDLKGFDKLLSEASSVTNISRMFAYCNNLESLKTDSYNNWVNGTNADVNIVRNLNNDGSYKTSFANASGYVTYPDETTLTTSGNFSIASAHKAGIPKLNMAKVTLMQGMFFGCRTLSSIAGIEVFDTSKVSDISDIFHYCRALEKIGEFGALDLNLVTNADVLFGGCDVLSDVKCPMLQMEKVTTITYMFADCTILTSLDDFAYCYTDSDNTMGWANLGAGSTTLSMAYMFSGTGLTCISNIDEESSFYKCLTFTKKATSMYRMFQKASLTSLKGLNLLSFDSITNLNYMFYACSSLTTLGINGSPYFPKATTAQYMFAECKLSNLDSFENWTIPIGSAGTFDANGAFTETSSTTVNMSYMFNRCNYMTYAIVSDAKISTISLPFTKNATNLNYMFNHCINLRKIQGFECLDFTKATSVYGMFSNCSALEDLSLTKTVDTSSITDASYMFASTKITNLDDLSKDNNWESFGSTSGVNMSYMFYCCKELDCLVKDESKTFSFFDNATDVSYMFFNIYTQSVERKLESVKLSQIFPAENKITNIDYLFRMQHALKYVDMSGINLNNLTTVYNNAFSSCTALKEIITPSAIAEGKSISLPKTFYVFDGNTTTDELEDYGKELKTAEGYDQISSSDVNKIISSVRYSIKFSSDEGTDLSFPGDIYVVYSSTVTQSFVINESLSGREAEGYAFDCWSIPSDATDYSYDASTQVLSIKAGHESDITLTAVWKDAVFIIYYNLNYDGVGSVEGNIQHLNDAGYSSALGSLPEEPTLNGYKFLGWFTLPSEGTEVTTSTTISSLYAITDDPGGSDIVIYAQWKEVFTIRIQAIDQDNNSLATYISIENASVEVVSGTGPSSVEAASFSVVDSQDITKTISYKVSEKVGYTIEFNGWYITYSTNSLDTSDKFTPDTTIYAVFNVNAKTYTLKYVYIYEDERGAKQTKVIDDSLTIPYDETLGQDRITDLERYTGGFVVEVTKESGVEKINHKVGALPLNINADTLCSELDVDHTNNTVTIEAVHVESTLYKMTVQIAYEDNDSSVDYGNIFDGDGNQLSEPYEVWITNKALSVDQRLKLGFTVMGDSDVEEKTIYAKVDTAVTVIGHSTQFAGWIIDSFGDGYVSAGTSQTPLSTAPIAKAVFKKTQTQYKIIYDYSYTDATGNTVTQVQNGITPFTYGQKLDIGYETEAKNNISSLSSAVHHVYETDNATYKKYYNAIDYWQVNGTQITKDTILSNSVFSDADLTDNDTITIYAHFVSTQADYLMTLELVYEDGTTARGAIYDGETDDEVGSNQIWISVYSNAGLSTWENPATNNLELWYLTVMDKSIYARSEYTGYITELIGYKLNGNYITTDLTMTDITSAPTVQAVFSKTAKTYKITLKGYTGQSGLPGEAGYTASQNVDFYITYEQKLSEAKRVSDSITYSTPTQTKSHDFKGFMWTLGAYIDLKKPFSEWKAKYYSSLDYDAELTNGYVDVTGLIIEGHWTLREFEVKISTNNSNYGSVDKSSVTAEYGTIIEVDSSDRLKLLIGSEVVVAKINGETLSEKYDFENWSTSLDGADLAELAIGEEMTIYASFKMFKLTYLIYFMNNYNELDENAHTTIEAGYEDSISLPESPTRTGYKFSGWFTDRGGTKNQLFISVSVNVLKATYNGDVDSDARKAWIYAIWTPEVRTITIIAVDSSNAEVNYAGINNATSNEVKYTNVPYDSTISVSADDVLTISYNKSATKVSLSPKTTNDENLLKGYIYEFVKWRTSDGAEITTAEDYVVQDTVTIYAEFSKTAREYKILLELYGGPSLNNDGSVSSGGSSAYVKLSYDQSLSQAVDFDDGTPIALTPANTRSHEFVKWQTLGEVPIDVELPFSEYSATYIEFSGFDYKNPNPTYVGNCVLAIYGAWEIKAFDVTISVSGEGQVSSTKIEKVKFGTSPSKVLSSSFTLNGTSITTSPTYLLGHTTICVGFEYDREAVSDYGILSETGNLSTATYIIAPTTITAIFTRTENTYIVQLYNYDGVGTIKEVTIGYNQTLGDAAGYVTPSDIASHEFKGWFASELFSDSVETTTPFRDYSSLNVLNSSGKPINYDVKNLKVKIYAKWDIFKYSVTIQVVQDGLWGYLGTVGKSEDATTYEIAISEVAYGSTINRISAVTANASAQIKIDNVEGDDSRIYAIPYIEAGYETRIDKWKWVRESGETQIKVGDKITSDSTIVVYFSRTALDYTLNLMRNFDSKDTNAYTSIIVKYGEKIGALPSDLNEYRRGYDFAGWFSGNSSGIEITSETILADGGSLEINHVAHCVNIYACWNLETYKISVTINNADLGSIDCLSLEQVEFGTSFEISNKAASFGERTINAIPKATIYGYDVVISSWTFGGEPISTGKVEGPMEICVNFEKIAKEVMVYLEVYTKDESGNKISGNPTIIGDDTKTLTFDSVYGELPEPKLEGYSFAGWFKDANFNEFVGENTTVKNERTHKLYAKWIKETEEMSAEKLVLYIIIGLAIVLIIVIITIILRTIKAKRRQEMEL